MDKKGALASPGSLEARSADDPDLRQKIKEGRAKADEDLAAIEHWARTGFNGGSGSNGG